MTTIVEFLNARLDEDVATAKAASEASWEFDEDWANVVSNGSHVVANIRSQPGDGQHIARHDPARVLAEVQAKRQLLDLHKPVPSSPDGPQPPVTVCAECGPDEHMLLSPGGAGDWYPCDTVRLLVLSDADHPDYDPAWRP